MISLYDGACCTTLHSDQTCERAITACNCLYPKYTHTLDHTRDHLALCLWIFCTNQQPVNIVVAFVRPSNVQTCRKPAKHSPSLAIGPVARSSFTTFKEAFW
jgi:hypothetical protein